VTLSDTVAILNPNTINHGLMVQLTLKPMTRTLLVKYHAPKDIAVDPNSIPLIAQMACAVQIMVGVELRKGTVPNRTV
jgi:hypothetical protein